MSSFLFTTITLGLLSLLYNNNNNNNNYYYYYFQSCFALLLLLLLFCNLKNLKNSKYIVLKITMRQEHVLSKAKLYSGPPSECVKNLKLPWKQVYSDIFWFSYFKFNFSIIKTFPGACSSQRTIISIFSYCSKLPINFLVALQDAGLFLNSSGKLRLNF